MIHRRTSCMVLLSLVCSLAATHARQALAEADLDAPREPQEQFERGAASWTEFEVYGEVAHLVFTFPATILRFDLGSRSFLPSIDFTDSPRTIAFSETHLFVGFDDRVEIMDHDGSSPSTLFPLAESPSAIFYAAGVVYVGQPELISSYAAGDGTFIDSLGTSIYEYTGYSMNEAGTRLFARSVGVSPSDIHQISLAGDGSFEGRDDSSFHGDFPGANYTWALPANQGVIDNSGTMYSEDLNEFLGAVGPPINTIAFGESSWVVVRGSVATLYDAVKRLAWERADFTAAPEDVIVDDTDVLGFSSGVSGVEVEILPLSVFVAPSPFPLQDPSSISFEPDEILTDGGSLFLYDEETLNIFQWSMAEQTYVESFGLTGTPTRIGVSSVHQRLYVGYPDFLVTSFDTSPERGLPVEVPFLMAGNPVCGLEAIGPWLFVCDPSGEYISHEIRTAEGALVSSSTGSNYPSAEYAWHPDLERLYYFRSGSPKDIIAERIDVDTGIVGSRMDSPLHTSLGFEFPIVLDPDGTVLVLGSGYYHDPVTLERLDKMNVSFEAAVWPDGNLYTLRSFAGDSVLEVWNRFLTAPFDTWLVAGEPLALAEYGGDLVVVTQGVQRPTFSFAASALLFEDGFESGTVEAWD